jgi:hypothetical protein
MAWAAIAQAFNARFPAHARNQVNLQVRYSRSLAPRHSQGSARVGALLLLTQQQQAPGMHKPLFRVKRFGSSTLSYLSASTTFLSSLFSYPQSIFALAVLVFSQYPNRYVYIAPAPKSSLRLHQLRRLQLHLHQQRHLQRHLRQHQHLRPQHQRSRRLAPPTPQANWLNLWDGFFAAQLVRPLSLRRPHPAH